MYWIILFCLLTSISSIRILFSPGSQVKKSFYKPFIDKLQTKLNTPIYFYDEIPSNRINDDQEIIISHSFGGTIALCDFLSKKRQRVIGSVLINSHFNHRSKMPYFPIDQKRINIPTLTILNTKDERLPLTSSIDDFLVSYQENIPKKYYLLNNGTHFSSFENNKEMDLLVLQVSNFVKESIGGNFQRTSYVTNYITNKHGWFFNDRNLSNTNIINNFPRFLVSNPFQNNSFYLNTKYILYKTNNINITKVLNQYFDLNINYNITNLRDIHYYDYLNSTDTVIKIAKNFMKGATPLNLYLITEFFIKDIINEFIYRLKIPFLLIQWFTYEPRMSINNSTLYCEVLSVPIRDQIVYYKFPSKNKMFEFLCDIA